MGAQHAAEFFAEIGRDSVFGIHAVEVEGQRERRQRVKLGFGDLAGFFHLCQNHVAALPGALVLPHGVVIRWIFHHTYQCGGFFYLKILRGLAEVDVCG